VFWRFESYTLGVDGERDRSKPWDLDAWGLSHPWGMVGLNTLFSCSFCLLVWWRDGFRDWGIYLSTGLIAGPVWTLVWLRFMRRKPRLGRVLDSTDSEIPS
jgi:hypothetical protein